MTTYFSFLRNLAYKYSFSPETRKILPKHYLKRCDEFMKRKPKPVHWRPATAKYKHNPHTGQRIPIQNIPVRVIYPMESNKGLWGGEGIVVGFRKRAPDAHRNPMIWRPFLTRRILYSEILDKHFDIQVTLRTLDLIDEAYGFDNYILKTHEVDLNSQLAMKIRGEILKALATKSIYPDDPVKREKFFKKYEQFVVPVEEAEWVGLTPGEAVKKARILLKQNDPQVPLKEVFTQELVKKLTEGTLQPAEETTSLLSKLNPFGSKTKEKS